MAGALPLIAAPAITTAAIETEVTPTITNIGIQDAGRTFELSAGGDPQVAAPHPGQCLSFG